jgi:hypothetical protein
MRVVRGLARFLPPLAGPEAAREVAESLEGRGTCLTRSLAVAARLPGGRVAIGVDPSNVRVLAHAWVEKDGVPLRASDPRGTVIAKL